MKNKVIVIESLKLNLKKINGSIRLVLDMYASQMSYFETQANIKSLKSTCITAVVGLAR